MRCGTRAALPGWEANIHEGVRVEDSLEVVEEIFGELLLCSARLLLRRSSCRSVFLFHRGRESAGSGRGPGERPLGGLEQAARRRQSWSCAAAVDGGRRQRLGAFHVAQFGPTQLRSELGRRRARQVTGPKASQQMTQTCDQTKSGTCWTSGLAGPFVQYPPEAKKKKDNSISARECCRLCYPGVIKL